MQLRSLAEAQLGAAWTLSAVRNAVGGWSHAAQAARVLVSRDANPHGPWRMDRTD